MTSRERILQRLRSGQTSRQSQASELAFQASTSKLAESQWQAEFIQNLLDNHAEVIEASEADWQQQVADVLRGKQIKHCLIGNSDEGKALAQDLENDNSELSVQLYARKQDKETLFAEVDAGISFACAGLAETGSLVVHTGPQEPRSLSLVPPLNIMLVKQSQLLADFNQLVQSQMWQQAFAAEQKPTNMLLVSGPSKTADIQQTLAFGAHGPKELVVILINDSK